jgi:hypothetical protein
MVPSCRCKLSVQALQPSPAAQRGCERAVLRTSFRVRTQSYRPNSPVESRLARPQHSLTIGPLHQLFAVSVFPFFKGSGAKRAWEPRGRDKQKWHGVERIQAWWTGCYSAFNGTGTIEGDMDEAKVAHVTAILFGLLTIALLGLNMLSNM